MLEPTCLRSEGTIFWWSRRLPQKPRQKTVRLFKKNRYTAVLYHGSIQHHCNVDRIYSYTSIKTNFQDPRRNDDATQLCRYQSRCNNMLSRQWHGIVHAHRRLPCIITKGKEQSKCLFFFKRQAVRPVKAAIRLPTLERSNLHHIINPKETYELRIGSGNWCRFLTASQAVLIGTTLCELGHPQPAMPIQVEIIICSGSANDNI